MSVSQFGLSFTPINVMYAFKYNSMTVTAIHKQEGIPFNVTVPTQKEKSFMFFNSEIVF